MDFKGVYNPATTYELNDIVSYGANAYAYKYATSAAGNLPTDSTYWALMTSGVQYEGTWSNSTAYQPKDIVTFGPKAYIALLAHTAYDPTNATYWEVLSDGIRSLGAWSSATVKYFPGDVTTRGGTQYITNTYHTPDATFSVDLAASKWSVFAAGLRYREAWATSTAYLKDDLVTDSLNSYVANLDFTSNGVDFESETVGRWTLFTPGTDNLPAQADKQDYLLSTDGTDPLWTDSINLGGSATVAGVFYLGADAPAIASDEGLTNVIGFGVGDAGGSSDEFTQFTIWNKNVDGLASTDVIAQTHDGSDLDGFIDMGITGEFFSSEVYGITGPNDGYIFMVAPAGTTGAGNLVLATGDTGTQNKIIFAAGGLVSGTTQMEITPGERVAISIPTPSTSSSTGALTIVGGIGTQGDVNILGSVTINGSLQVAGGAFTTETLVSSTPIFSTGTNATGNIPDRGYVAEYKKSVAAVSFDIGSVLRGSSVGTITRKGYTTLTKAITSDVGTVQVQEVSHSIVVGDTVVLAGLGAPHDGAKTITAVTGTTFSYAAVASDAAPAADTDGTVAVDIPSSIVNGDRVTIADCTVAIFDGHRDFVIARSGNTLTFTMTGTTALTTVAAGTATVDTKTKFTGLVRNATNEGWYLIDTLSTTTSGSLQIAPTSDIDFADVGITYPTLNVGGLAFQGTPSVTGDITFPGNPTFSGNVTMSGSANLLSGTFTGNPTLSGNPTFSGDPTFSGAPSFSGTPVFTGGIRVQEMVEDVVDVSQSSNVITADYSLGNIFYVTNSLVATTTLNVTNAPTTDGRIFTVSVLVTQTATGYAPTTFQIAGVGTTVKWIGGVVPTPTSSSGKIDIFTYTFLRRAATWTVFGAASLNQ